MANLKSKSKNSVKKFFLGVFSGMIVNADTSRACVRLEITVTERICKTMLFCSIEFIFLFMPIFLLIYYTVPEKYGNLILFLGSLFFYAYGEHRFSG